MITLQVYQAMLEITFCSIQEGICIFDYHILKIFILLKLLKCMSENLLEDIVRELKELRIANKVLKKKNREIKRRFKEMKKEKSVNRALIARRIKKPTYLGTNRDVLS